MAYIEPTEAVTQIVSNAKALLHDEGTESDNVYTLYANKLVMDVLDYCHREDFPQALVYTCADLLVKRVEDSTSDTKGLKSIKMDDTEFQFATATATAGTMADNDFGTIRNKLNLYRRVGGWR